MLKSFGTLLLFLTFISLRGLGQELPALETFISPDGAFQFVYPQNYELLIGDRMLRATQGKHLEIPVCDFLKASMCLIYPFDTSQDGRFEAAALSVRTLPDAIAEPDCLAYADQAEGARGEKIPFLSISISINGRIFRQASLKRTRSGHFQSADLYRIFSKDKCYELQIGITMLQEPALQKASKSSSLGNTEADAARESLQLILSSVIFQQ